MEYVIMRKDVPITIADFSDEGKMLWFSRKIKNEELAPLQEKNSSDWLIDWWNQRSVPVSQTGIKEMLLSKDLVCTDEYLLKNLGLSLTDYYWIKPIDSPLTWKNVNLFNNDFSTELVFDSLKTNSDENTRYKFTPNSSLQGQLEKKWIIVDGERCLVKGNQDEYSSESINECIASKLHELQGYDNYTNYDLLKIKNTEYDYGCISKCFTSEKLELVSAYGVVSSEKQPNDMCSYEHFINVCGKYGIDTEILRRDLEYQIQTDFIMSNTDRHLSNVSILRDADSLQFIRMAPIYDTGKSLFVGKVVAKSEKELLNIQTTSFVSTELKLLKYVKDRSLVDVTKLPSPSFIREKYMCDSQVDKERLEKIIEAYERKIDLYRTFQLGGDLNQIKISYH